MIASRQVATGVAALLASTAITACDDYSIALGPEPTLTGLHMTVKTSETWGTRKLMIVGEEGSVRVTCSWSHGIGSPCEPEPRIVSSAPDCVSVHAEVWGSSATLRAHAPGMAVISAKVRGITRDTTIHVYSDPLPIDDLWVEPGGWRDGSWWEPEDWCPACQLVYESPGRLEKIRMPVSGSLAFQVHARREGERVSGLKPELASTDEGVAYASKRCRPAALDPDCDVHSPHWVSALAPGTATVSVAARNLTISFGVEVTDAP